MLSKKEFDKISTYLSLLACGILDNGLSADEEREVLMLSNKCLECVDEVDNTETTY